VGTWPWEQHTCSGRSPPARGLHTLAAAWLGGGASRSLATLARAAGMAPAGPPVESLVVRIDKVTGDVYVSRVADAGAAFAAFKACLLLWHTMSSSGRGRDGGLLVKETRES
jgi:hypothetical protein